MFLFYEKPALIKFFQNRRTIGFRGGIEITIQVVQMGSGELKD